MRLFLSSYKFGDHQERFFDLINEPGSKIAVISNAADYHSEEDIVERIKEDVEVCSEFGYKAERLDLREYFGKQDELADKIAEYSALWLRGGNSFILRRAAEYSGFGQIVKKLLAEDQIVLGGYSAGACLISLTLHGVELCDDPYDVPEGYSEEIIWDGLGLVPYAIAPHYDSDHPESAMIDEVINYFYENDIPHKKLRDGEVIIINDQVETEE